MIAEKIKKLREARGWSQAELARRLSSVNVTGLSAKEVALLTEMADMLRGKTEK